MRATDLFYAVFKIRGRYGCGRMFRGAIQRTLKMKDRIHELRTAGLLPGTAKGKKVDLSSETAEKNTAHHSCAFQYNAEDFTHVQL